MIDAPMSDQFFMVSVCVLALLLVAVLCVEFYILQSSKWLDNPEHFEEDYRLDAEVPKLALPDTSAFDVLIAELKAKQAELWRPKLMQRRERRGR